MPTPSLILWIDSSSSRLVSGWQSSGTANNLIFNQGDSVGIELHRVNAISGNFMSEVEFPETGNITLAIGTIETAPTSGSYVISYNGESTGAIAYNATATDIQTALNGLTSITSDGGVTVSLTGNIFRVIWNNNGVRSHAITVGSNNLFPTSSVGIDIVRAGTSSVRQITQLHIKQSPVALCSTWVNQDDAVITCTQIHTPTFVGDVKVWRVSISPQPRGGNFLLSYQYGSTTYRTQPLDVSSSSGSILSVLSSLNSNLENFTVTQSGTYSWDIATTSSDVLNFTATGAGIVSFKAKYGVLNLNTIEVQDLLAGSASSPAYVEVQLATDTTTTTLYQGTCTVLNDLIDNDGATVVSRGDVMPVDSVVRYDTSQSLNDSQKSQARTNIGALGSTSLDSFTAKDIELETRIVVAESNLLTTDQKNALSGSSSPSGSNVFITNSVLQSNIVAINNVSLLANNTFAGTQRFNNKVGINVAPDTAIGLHLDATGVLFSDGSIQTTASIPFYKFAENVDITSAKIRIIPNIPFFVDNSKSLYICSKQLKSFEYTHDSDSVNYKTFNISNELINRIIIKDVIRITNVTINNCNNLNELKIACDSGSIAPTVFTGTISVTNCSSIKSVNLKNINFSTNSTSNFNFTAPSGFLRLSLTGLSFTTISSNWYNSSLETLTLDSTPLTSFSFINPTTFPHLKYLRLGQFANIPIPNCSGFTELETLIIRNYSGTGIGNVLVPTSLKSLNVSGLSFITSAFGTGIWSCTNMKIVNFRDCSCTDDITDFPVGSNLEHFDFTNNNLGNGEYGTATLFLNAVNALNTSGAINPDKPCIGKNQKGIFLTGANMPMFPSVPASVVALRSRGWHIEGNNL